MAQKNSFRPYFVVYIIAMITSLGSGIPLKLFCTDPTTGFINTGTFPGDFILVIIFRLSILLPILFWFILTMKRRANHDYPISYRHRVAGILAAITGLCIIIYSVSEVPWQVISEQLLREDPNILVIDSVSSRALIVVVAIIGILAGLSLIYTLRRPNYYSSTKPGVLLGFLPALWQIIVLFSRFNNFIAVTTISDILMILLFMCFAAVFLIGQSRVMFGLGVRSGKTYAISAGFSVSLIGFNLTITAILNYFMHGTFTFVVTLGIAEFCYIFFLSLYAIVFVRGFTHAVKTV